MRPTSAPDDRLQSERALQLALQICLDVAAHLVGELGLPPPEEYGQTFVRLGEAEVVPSVLAGRLADAAGLRNRLVRGYADLDDAQVFAALASLASLESLDDLRAFARAAATIAASSPPA